MASFHISRWKYWWAYIAIITLAIITMWLSDKARDTAAWTAGIVTLAMFIWFEVLIRKEKLKLTADGIEYRKGKERVDASFSQIARYGARQTNLQKLLGNGDVLIKTSKHGGNEIFLGNFQQAAKIERLLDKQFAKVHKKHKHAR